MLNLFYVIVTYCLCIAIQVLISTVFYVIIMLYVLCYCNLLSVYCYTSVDKYGILCNNYAICFMLL